jgi:hypothetical protein
MSYTKLRLSKGYITIIDKQLPKELRWILKVSWYAHKSRCNIYARNRKYGFLHRILKQTPKEFQTDHINGDTLDNRLDNLRNVTPKMNVQAHYERINNETIDYGNGQC